MSYLISYAQNFEDVILWRALRGVSHGNYIDIGAQSPDVDSVSRVFHEHGWHGLHVDAMRDYADALGKARPGDRVLCAAVAAKAGELQFFAIPHSGLSTSDRAIAERHMAEGFIVEEVRVEAVTLDQVFLRAGFEEVHWLKIDIEGYEAQAIEGWKDSLLRPWIVVVESTIPLSQESSFSEWEPSLLSKGYRFVYFDGLNRFYVSSDHPELAESFGPGPNVFDNFTLSGMASMPFTRGIVAQRDDAVEQARGLAAEVSDTRAQVAAAEAVSHHLEERLSTARMEVAALQHRADEAELIFREVVSLRADREKLSAESWTQAQSAHRWWMQADALGKELSQVHASLSWRLTRPLRAIGLGSLMKSLVRKLFRAPLILAMRFALRLPVLRRIVTRIVRIHPGIDARLKRVAVNNGLAAASNVSPGTAALSAGSGGRLGTRTTRILDDLERAMKIKGA